MGGGRTLSVAILLRLLLAGAPCSATGGELKIRTAADGAKTLQAAHGDARSTGKAATSAYYAVEMSDLFAAYATSRASKVEKHHQGERDRLEKAISQALDANDKALLEFAASVDEEERLISHNALNELKNFANTLKQAMGAQGGAASCGELTCGAHAYCSIAGGRAQCSCAAGYQGNGFLCNPPTSLVEHSLMQHLSPSGPPAQVADIHVAALRGGRVAVVYRDAAQGNAGYVLLGKALATGVEWGKPLQLGNSSQVWEPVLTELEDGSGVAVAFRDEERGGTALLVGGRWLPDHEGLAFGEPRAFARQQAILGVQSMEDAGKDEPAGPDFVAEFLAAQRMAVVPLTGSAVAVFFAEHAPAPQGTQLATGGIYGSALLARVHANGTAATVLGKQRFVAGPVARLSAAMLSPSSFVVAYRGHAAQAGAASAEASVIFGQFRGEGLVFEPRTLQVEPGQHQIWARSVAHIQDGVFAYTYHSGVEQLTKQVIVRVDPVTHQMSLLRAPTVLGRGFSPVLGTLSTSMWPTKQAPEQVEMLKRQGPRLFSYFADRGDSRGNFCKVSAEGAPTACQAVAWPKRELVSAAGAPTGDGRVVLVYTDARGAPYYQLVGLMDPV